MQDASSKSVYRFTSVLTARRGRIRYFRSRGEVPADLQRDLDKALHGELTANVILADEGGQAYLQSHTKPNDPVVSPTTSNGRQWLARRLAFEAVAGAALAIVLWLLAGSH